MQRPKAKAQAQAQAVKFGLIAILAALVFAGPARPGEMYEYSTYFGTTGEIVHIEWSPVEGALGYEVQLLSKEREVIETLPDPWTPLPRDYIALPYSGHFVVRVRACKEKQKDCSEWALSTNPEVATVNGNPGAWWLYGHIAPTGPITIDDWRENP